MKLPPLFGIFFWLGGGVRRHNWHSFGSGETLGSHPHVNFIIIVLGWMEDRRRWGQEIEDFVANEENEEILEWYFIYLEDPFFGGENRFSEIEALSAIGAIPLPSHCQCNSDPSVHSVHSPIHWAHWVDHDRGGALSALGASKPHSAVILMWDRWIYLYLRVFLTKFVF